MRLIMISFLLIYGCGSEQTVSEPPPRPAPPGDGGGDPGGNPGGDPGGDITYPEMQALLNNYCQSCHASARFMQSEAALRGSRVEEELITRSMPVASANKKLPDAERATMISFF